MTLSTRRSLHRFFRWTWSMRPCALAPVRLLLVLVLLVPVPLALALRAPLVLLLRGRLRCSPLLPQRWLAQRRQRRPLTRPRLRPRRFRCVKWQSTKHPWSVGSTRAPLLPPWRCCALGSKLIPVTSNRECALTSGVVVSAFVVPLAATSTRRPPVLSSQGSCSLCLSGLVWI